MSKEMAVIALGALVILTRTFLGVPGNWQTVILVAAGAALVVLGFLLRGEAIGRQTHAHRHNTHKASLPFADNLTEPAPASETHEQKDRITSLN